MKNKFLILFIIVAVVASVLAFSACVDTNGNTDKEYTITCVSGDNYTVTSSLTSAKAGARVEITVNADEYCEVESVTANDKNCEKNLAGKYELIMPAEDVTVKATVKAMPDVNVDDGLSWTTAPSSIAVGRAGDIWTNQTFAVDFGGKNIINSTDSDGNMIYVKIKSTNQDVIPDEAISGAEATNVLYGSMATGAQFTIDLMKVKKGTTRLVVNVDGRELIKTINVCDYGTVEPENLYREKVVVDLSELKGEYDNLRIWIYDNDYIYGSVYNQTQWKDFKFADGNYEFEFSYTPDHTFSISIGYEYYDENVQDYRYKYFEIMDENLGGSSSTGFTAIMSDPDYGHVISFRQDGESITAVVTD